MPILFKNYENLRKETLNLLYLASFGILDFMGRRSYSVDLSLNGRHIQKVIIDPHYEIKHSASITDELILELVQIYLDGEEFESISGPDENGFEYFVRDHLKLKGRAYKLVWLLNENEVYIGILNAYRRD